MDILLKNLAKKIKTFADVERLKEENPEKLKEYRKKAYMNRKQKDTVHD